METYSVYEIHRPKANGLRVSFKKYSKSCAQS